MMRARVLLLLALGLAPSLLTAQTVGQGAPAATTDAKAWPVKIVFGDTQIDPRSSGGADLTSSTVLTMTNDAATIAVVGRSVGTIYVSGQNEEGAALVAEATSDGTNWVTPLPVYKAIDDTLAAGIVFSTHTYILSVAGFHSVRVRWDSGSGDTVTVAWRLSGAPAPVLTSALATAANQASEIILLSDIDANVAGSTNVNNDFATAGVEIAAQFDDASTLACTENNSCFPRITELRALHTSLRNGTGQEIVSSNTTPGVNDIGLVVRLPTLPALIASSAVIGHIICDSGCGSPPATADNSAFTFGTTSVSPIGFVVDDVGTNNVTENSFGAPRMSTGRLLYADLSKSASNTNAFAVSGTFWQATQPVSGTFWQATQPISGTVTANAGTNLNTSALALDASLTTRISTGIGPLDNETNTVLFGRVGTYNWVYDGSTWDRMPGTSALGVKSEITAIAAGSNIIGNIRIDQTTPGTTNAVQANAGTNLNTSALALEAGHLATIDTSTAKIPAQGQALAAASMPVVLTAAQITTLTPPAAIAGFALEATQLTGNTSIASVKTNTDPLVTAGGGGYVRQDSTATMAKETGGNLATVKTNTDPLVAAAAGGYVRQDSTATIARESGGNLATIAGAVAKPTSCGVTPYDSGSLDVPSFVPTSVVASTTCVTAVTVVNQTRTPVRFTLGDGSTPSRTYFNDWVSPGGAVTVPLGVSFASGVKWNASSPGLSAQVRGYQ